MRNWVTAAILTLLALPAGSSCPLWLRFYEDLDSRHLVLEFDPPASDQGVALIAVANIRHPERGEIERFEVVASPGYGSVYLVSGERDHAAYFFTDNLHSTRSPEDSSLLFVEGIGLADWEEGEPPGNREHPLGDVLWKLVGCKE